MSQSQRFVVSAECRGDDHSATLLRLVSALHRRRVDVVEAHLTAPAPGVRRLTATFIADARRAETVRKTLANLIGVVGVRIREAPGSPSHTAEIAPGSGTTSAGGDSSSYRALAL